MLSHAVFVGLLLRKAETSITLLISVVSFQTSPFLTEIYLPLILTNGGFICSNTRIHGGDALPSAAHVKQLAEGLIYRRTLDA